MAEQLMNIAKVLRTLSDENCLSIFEKVNKATDTKNGVILVKPDNQTTRKYYSPLTKLKNAHLIKRSGNKAYRATVLGRVLYYLLHNWKVACTLSWNFHALDQLEEVSIIPQKEKIKVIQSLVPDRVLQKILFAEVIND